DGFVGDLEPRLGEELLDVSITQREAQVEPDCMLDDHRRKAVAAVRDFSHRTSLPVVSASGLSGYPDKAIGFKIDYGEHVSLVLWPGGKVTKERTHPDLHFRFWAEYFRGPHHRVR